MRLPNELQNLKRVTVFGMGKSGVAAVKLLKTAGLEVHAVNEGPVSSWQSKDGLAELLATSFLQTQDESAELFAASDLIVISPGIPTTHKILEKAVARQVPIVSEIELAYWFTRATPVIAITGTNGKTTTTTMIFEALKLAGKKVFCGGNIGIPYCEMALAVLAGEKFDYAVIEVSSFQLETIREFHPHIGLMLNLTLNHSERYQGLDDYGQAKLRIALNMKSHDHLIVGMESGPWVQWSEKLPPVRHLFAKNDLPKEFLSQFDFAKGVLVGVHNRANYYCAWKTLSLLGIPDLKTLFQQFIENFRGVEHRLEFVGEFHGLKVYNDAKSTNGEATRTALAAFDDNKPLYLIVGGKLRNESDRLLPDLVGFKTKVSKILTIGETTERLEKELAAEFNVVACRTIRDVLQWVKRERITGNLVFSPAHPSFDQFKNYVDRGQQFKSAAKEILA
jgi:UDP-N-acetylmuramoylalanine--D-glutamate ligase